MRGILEQPNRPVYYGTSYGKIERPSEGTLDPRLYLKDLSRDDRSGLLIGPSSLAMRYLLPLEDLERNVPKDTGEVQERFDMLFATHPSFRDKWAAHVTGSSIERFFVPPYTERHQARTTDTEVAGAADNQGAETAGTGTVRTADNGTAETAYNGRAGTADSGGAATVNEGARTTDNNGAEAPTDGAVEGRDAQGEQMAGDDGVDKTNRKGTNRADNERARVMDIEEGRPADITGTMTDIGTAGTTEEAPDRGRAKSQPEAFFTIADTDVMVEFKQLQVALRHGAGLMYMDEAKASHKGYTRIVLDAKEQVFQHIKTLQCFCKKVTEDGRETWYVSIDMLNDSLAMLLPKHMENCDVHRQGPAINVKRNEAEKGPGGEFSFISDYDFVPALPLSERLPALITWLQRVNDTAVNWPPKETRDDIQKNGRCFLVGAGHSISDRRDLEWRISFSDPEKRLARSLTPIQRKVYLLIKMLQKCFLKEPKVLVTYHIKTLMFWEMESTKLQEWTEVNLFQHVLNILSRIERCLAERCIPSYFLPDNNLISHVPEADIVQILNLVSQIRQRPLEHLYQVDERFQFDFSTSEPLSELYRPLRIAVEEEKVEDIPDALVISIIQHVKSDIQRGLHISPRCASLLWEAWKILLPEQGPHPIYSEWIMFAAAATFSSMEVRESSWLIEVLRIAYDAEAKASGPAHELSEDEKALLQQVVRSSERADEGESTLGVITRSVLQSGTLPVERPIFDVLSLRHAQLEMLRDLKHNAENNLPGIPPMEALAKNTRINIEVIDLTVNLQRTLGVPNEIILQNTLEKVLAVIPRGEDPSSLASNLCGNVVQMLQSAGVPGDLLDKHHDELTSALGAASQQMQVGQQPQVNKFESDHRVVELLPFFMIGLYMKILGGTLSDEQVDVTYTPFFNMLGFFLKHKMYVPACRMSLRMTGTRLTTTSAELEKVVYDLSQARMLLDNFPTFVRKLVLMTPCHAALGAIYLLIDYVNLTLHGEFMGALLNTTADLEKLEKYSRTPSSTYVDDVLLTHLVIRLCVLTILDKDTNNCLSQVQQVVGETLRGQLESVLAEWKAHK